MAKNAKNEVAVKGRKTKLAKKSVEELIQIILRKDSTERNYATQIKNLKAEVNDLVSRLNNSVKDMEGTQKTIESFKTKYNSQIEATKVANEKLLSNQMELSEVKQDVKKWMSLYERERVTSKFYKHTTVVVVILAIVSVVLSVLS